MDVSPYLAAIQSVNGKDPGNKYRELHRIAIEIINDDNEKEEFLTKGVYKRVHPALLPLLKIVIGNKLKIYDIVVESLKSHDITVVKQALKAKWFFNNSNSSLNVENFVTNVIPYISLRTRRALIKRLANCLVNDTVKANNFFSTFADLYGNEQTLPLIIACSEQHIYSEVLKRKLKLSIKILNILYFKYPELVIRYLQLGNKENKENEDDRTKFTISIDDYRIFLPTLVKYHTQAFIELYKRCKIQYNEDSKPGIRLGNTRTNYFLKSATDELIQNPTVFLDVLSLKILSKKLNTERFERMYENLLPNKDNDIFFTTNIKKLIGYLKYYPEEKKFHFILEKYRLTYHKDLMETYNLITKSEFFEIVPKHLKEMWGRKMYDISTNEYRLDEYEDINLLPPREVYGKLKELIEKSESLDTISSLFNRVIYSCLTYEDEDVLLELLQYYSTLSKNERVDILGDILFSLHDKHFNKRLWCEFGKIVKIAYSEGYLFNNIKEYSLPFFEIFFHYCIEQSKQNIEEENQIFLEDLMDIILKGLFEHHIRWDFIKDCSDINKDSLQIFLTAIPRKYSANHSVWKEKDNKFWITRYLIQVMHKFNKNNAKVITRLKDSTVISTINTEKKNLQGNKFNIRDYPWLNAFIQDILKSNDTFDNEDEYLDFKIKLGEYDYEYYQNLINNDPDLINDVRTSDCLIILKRDPIKVLEKWKLYLNDCRKYLYKQKGYAKLFVKMTKWYHDLPVKFIKQCLLEIEETNSLSILGLLLEGEVFSKIIEPYLLEDKILDSTDKNVDIFNKIQPLLSRFMSYTNPPVSFKTVSLLCQNNSVSRVSNILWNFIQQTPVNEAVTLVEHLMKKSIAFKQLCIKLASQVLSKPDLYDFLIRIENQESDFSILQIICKLIFDMSSDFDKPKPEFYSFLKKMWSQVSDSMVRKTVIEMIFNTFTHYPNTDSWELMKLCLREDTNTDETIFKVTQNFNDIDRNYLTLYLEEYLKRIETVENSQLDKNKLFCGVVRKITDEIANMLSDNLITLIVKKHFNECNICENKSYDFELSSYLFLDPNKFDERLNIILSILENKMKNDDASSSIPKILSDLIIYNKRDMCLRLINGMLNVFLKVYDLFKNSEIHLSLKIYKSYFETTTAKEFGFKCCKIAKEFDDDKYIFNVVYDLRKIFKKSDIYHEDTSKVMVLEGLIECDKRLGALIGIEATRIKLIYPSKRLINIENHEKLLKIWGTVEDETVKAAWNSFLAGYVLTDDKESNVNFCKKC